MTSGSNCRHLNRPQTEEARRSIRPAYHGLPVKLQHCQLDDNGKKIEFIVKVGDKVLISKYGGTEIKIDGENYLIMREDDILGIIG